MPKGEKNSISQSMYLSYLVISLSASDLSLFLSLSMFFLIFPPTTTSAAAAAAAASDPPHSPYPQRYRLPSNLSREH